MQIRNLAESPSGKPGIDPVLRTLLDAFPFKVNLDDGVEMARDQARAFIPPPELLPELRIEERSIGYGEIAEVPVRIYWPPVEQHDNLPVVVFYHGGGMAVGGLDSHDAIARAHAIVAEAIVVSVDYRLAPEHPYPQAIEDSWAALRWVGEHAGELGGDPSRIAVAGDSAGGNISAVMTQLARDNGGPALAFQLLWYPSTTGDVTLPSMVEHADAPFMDKVGFEAFMRWYLPPDLDISEPAKLPHTLVPANGNLSGLPPAYIGIAEYDVIRDDGARYADLLAAAGVPVELHLSPTLSHAYLNFAPVVPAAAEATNRGLEALKVALRRD